MTPWQPAGSGHPVVCAHRGASAHAPENTVDAARLAGEHGAAWIEFDVRPSADDLVVHHDPTTTDGLVVGELASADPGRVLPSFGAFVGACGSMGLDVEMKTDGFDMSTEAFVDLVAEQIDRHCADHGTDRLIVTSFDQHALDRFHELRPSIATGVLFHDRPTSWAIDRAVDLGHRAIVPWYRLVTPARVDAAHEAGLAVATWTVNRVDDMQAVASAGVDMVIGDDPALIIETLSST